MQKTYKRRKILFHNKIVYTVRTVRSFGVTSDKFKADKSCAEIINYIIPEKNIFLGLVVEPLILLLLQRLIRAACSTFTVASDETILTQFVIMCGAPNVSCQSHLVGLTNTLT